MYIPTAFNQPDRDTLHAFIEANSFALLCSTGEGGLPFASHLPLLLERSTAPLGVLVGHMARANPQWQQADGRPVLAVFSGPHTYISPSWYEAEGVVPTWNYVAVHVTGVLRAVHDRDALLRIVLDTVATYEGRRPTPWGVDGSAAYLDRLLKAIVGFRIEITGLEGKWKLSQNHPPERREKVIRALREQGGEDSEEIAGLMERLGS
ncbi:MAG: FMN-binding negative transcriptional regulator [Gemmataceae bacterium]|nr:FMN-binding negative transcriptional regulator [Gemmataceae bacterium]